jgi:hypothetical protein
MFGIGRSLVDVRCGLPAGTCLIAKAGIYAHSLGRGRAHFATCGRLVRISSDMKTTSIGLKLYAGRCPLQKGLGELYEVCSICLSGSILMDPGTSIAILASRTKVRQTGMAIDKGDGVPAITPGGGARSRHTVTGSHVRSAYELCAHAASASSRPCQVGSITNAT